MLESLIIYTFSQNLKRLIKERTITTGELARKANIPLGTIKNWRKCKSFPSLRNLEKLTTALTCTVNDLFLEIKDDDGIL